MFAPRRIFDPQLELLEPVLVAATGGRRDVPLKRDSRPGYMDEPPITLYACNARPACRCPPTGSYQTLNGPCPWTYVRERGQTSTPAPRSFSSELDDSAIW